jgi:hypothetical protein
MVLKIIFIAAALMLAACQSAAPLNHSTATPPVTDPTTTPHWLETTLNGITLGMWQPEGWETLMSNGLIIAEQTPGNAVDDGMLIYVFVPPIDQFGVPMTDANLAWAVLNRVIHMPSHTGRDLVVSPPAGFEWGDYDAAYYLLTTGDGMRALVLALAIPGQQKVIVCNISSPSDRAYQIRAMLPQLFDGLQIDGQTLPGAPLDGLPDPLPFPRYISSTAANRQMTSDGSPP